MKAIAQLLSALPLQPEATDVDIMEAKSELFLKWVSWVVCEKGVCFVV